MTTVPEPRTDELPPIHELTDAEACQMFDDLAEASLGISGAEFLRRWDAGEYAGVDETNIVGLALLIPFCRRPIESPDRDR